MGRSCAEAVKALVRRILFAVGLETMWWCLTTTLPLAPLRCAEALSVARACVLCCASLFVDEGFFVVFLGMLDVWPAAPTASVMVRTSPVLQPAWNLAQPLKCIFRPPEPIVSA